MKIPFQSFTFPSFIEMIMSMEMTPPERFKVACFLTHFDQWSGDRIPSLRDIFLQRGFQIETMGEIVRLSASYFDVETRQRKMATFYAYLNSETRLLLCFTDEKTEAIDQTIGEVANTSPGIYYMFVSPTIFTEIRAKITERFPGSTCYYFTAKHLPQFARKGETRPNVERTIIYHGEDAFQTLEEVQQYYGASPRIMRYRIPDLGKYEIKNTDTSH